MIKGFLILIALQAAVAEWSPLTTIFTGDQTVTSICSYYDSHNGVTHIMAGEDDFFKGSMSFHMHYIRFFPNGTKTTKLITIPNQYIRGAQLSGSADGKKMFMVIGVESSYNWVSTLYFSESTNGGGTWTEPEELPKNNDYTNRKGCSILYIERTGRLFIFYHISGVYSTDSAIFYVTRASGSKIFSFENRVKYTDGYDISAVYTTSNYDSMTNKITIHLMWIQGRTFKSKETIYIKSQDNGIRWSEEYIIGKNVGLLSQDYPFPSQRIFAHSDFPQSLFYTGYSYDDAKREYSRLFLRHSKDNGNSWSAPIYLSTKNIISDLFINLQNVLSAELYKKGDKPVLVFFAHPDLNTLEFGSVDLESFKVTHETHPFPSGSKQRQSVAFCPHLVSKAPVLVSKGSNLMISFYY